MALFGLLGGKKTSVGLDIGSGILKVAVIDHSGSEPELVKVATTEVAADAIVEGEVMDPGIVAEAIRGLFSAAGVKQKQVVTAVGGRDVIVKKIQMDRMKEADAREVIRWEAEQHVPFDMANVELDFQILDPSAEGLQMNVLLVASMRGARRSRWGWSGRRRSSPRRRARRVGCRVCTRRAAGHAFPASTTRCRAVSRCRWSRRIRCSGSRCGTPCSTPWRWTRWPRCSCSPWGSR